MADFAKYAPKLLQLEGGFVNHSDDKGGITNKGITLATYRAYCGQQKTIKDLQNISYGTWCKIMKDLYWDKVQGDKIENQSLAEIIADWAVDSGQLGIRKAQDIIGCKADGIVGSITISMINTSDASILHERIWKARQQFYINIVKRHPSQKMFMARWMNRLNKFQFE